MNLFKRTKLIQECQLLTGKGGGTFLFLCYIYICVLFMRTHSKIHNLGNLPLMQIAIATLKRLKRFEYVSIGTVPCNSGFA